MLGAWCPRFASALCELTWEVPPLDLPPSKKRKLFIPSLCQLALCAFSAYNNCMQYTLRNVPDHVDAALRRKAREQDKSLNDVAIEALAQGAGVGEQRSPRRDLSDIARTWKKDRAFEDAVAAQHTIDAELWR